MTFRARARAQPSAVLVIARSQASITSTSTISLSTSTNRSRSWYRSARSVIFFHSSKERRERGKSFLQHRCIALFRLGFVPNAPELISGDLYHLSRTEGQYPRHEADGMLEHSCFATIKKCFVTSSNMAKPK